MLHPHPAEDHRSRLLFDRQFDRPFVQITSLQHEPHFFTTALVAFRVLSRVLLLTQPNRSRQKHVQQARLHALLRLVLHILPFALADQADRVLDQFSHHALDVATVVTNFGVLGRLHFDKRSAGQLGQPTRNLRLANARRTDHQNVLGRDLSRHILGQLLAPPTIADGDRHRPLGVVLTHNVPVEFLNDLARRQVAQPVGHLRRTAC